ncbi:MAG TPA: UvrD-helicase domain-containing protein [Candidatus Saccharimonadales bacterium]|nr:UvrD-helicase domain-containing protein [Candidatus Saccharimonadales bacterium]
MSSPTPRAVPSDANIRKAVLDTTQSWMLQAPAGSGKTELLMQRFLACLARVEQPESVLAITFTRKAAAEMRSRILASLQRAEHLSDEDLSNCPPHEQQSLQLARAVLRTSDALGWNILQHPARLQVRTLDSFCESVAERAPFKGMLGGGAEVTEDARQLYELAAQRVLEQLASTGTLGDSVAALLVHMDNDVRGVRNLLAAMLAQRDEWLHFLGRSDAFDSSQRDTLRSKLEAALVLSVEEDLALVRTHVTSALNSAQELECLGLMRYSASQLSDGSMRPAQQIESIAASADVVPILLHTPTPRDIKAWPAATAANLDNWRSICEFLLIGSKAAFRKSVDKRHGFPVNTEEQKQWKKICLEFFGALSALPDSAALCDTLNRVRRLPDQHYTETQWQFMRAVLELLPMAAANLKVVFAEQATIDFPEYAQRALDAIGQEGDPTELGLQLGYRIRHILVDEFQDTNRVQVELLARLLRTWEQDEQCSTFYVGDPMQSIYAFRQADVAIYQQARTEGIGDHKHQFHRLSQNFRSQQSLVEWFNRIFPLILRNDSDLTNSVRYAPAEPSRPALASPAVLIKGFAKSDRAGEAKHLAECIRRELEIPTPPNEKPTTIAVLVRSRTHLPELVKALHDGRIDYRAVKTDRLSDRPLVRDLDALRSALTNLADRTAWLAILRAPWCGLALSDLLELCRGDERSTVYELLRQRVTRLSPQAQAALDRCVPVLEDALARRGRGSLRALVESAWLRLGGPACLEDQSQGIRDSEAYFALLDEQSSAGTVRDSETFARKLHDLFAPADNRSNIRVEIMPIHQAKGLEWDVVFLPALERRSRQDDKSLLYWRLRHRDEQEFLLLGPMEAPGKRDRKSVTIEGYLRDIAGECSREELKRLFYVAATRARKRLYLSAAVPDGVPPDTNSMLRLIWDIPEIHQQFALPSVQESIAPVDKKEVPELLLRRLPSSFKPPELTERLQWRTQPQPALEEEEHRFEWVGDLLPRVGVVAHSFLQRIAYEGPALWDAGRLESARRAISAALLRAGVQRGDLEQGITRVSEALSRTLSDKRGRWLLSPHEEHRCEFAVSAVIDGQLQHVRIDRTFIEHGTRWLIDYKISEQLGGDPRRFLRMQVEKYSSDMQRYARVMEVFDPRPVRCALYFPLLGEFCPIEMELPPC